MALVSPEGQFLQVNRAFCRFTGYPKAELITLNFQDLIHPDDFQADLTLVRHLLQGEINAFQLENRYRHKTGQWIWGLLSVSVIRDSQGQTSYFIAQIQDVSVHKKLEAERQAQSEAIRALVENAPDIIARLDTEGRVIYMNAAIETISGRSTTEFLGKSLNEVGLSEAFVSGFQVSLKQVLNSRQPTSLNYTGSDGQRHYHGRFVPEFDEAGHIASILVISRDITEIYRVQSELQAAEQKLKAANAELAQANAELAQTNERLLQLANHDGLTGLKNRRHFDERLREAISRAHRCRKRGESSELSLLLLDIDHFKVINDSLGHARGDDVLRTVAEILVQTLRLSDVVSRYGGEEFGVLLFDTDEVGSRRAAERCRQAVQEYPWKALPLTVSVGVTTWTDEDAQTLLVRADLALYAAKHGGRNCVRHASELAKFDG